MRKRFALILPHSTPNALIWLILGVLLPAGQVFGQLENHLQEAFDKTNPRMVKVFGASAGRVEGYATGFIVSDDGLILTAQGVFLDGRQVRVLLADGTEHEASVVRRDRERQLALLKINHETPDHFVLAESDIGKKGDWVIAISNAFRVADKEEPLSATLGIISLRTTIEAWLNQRDVAYIGDLVLIDPITSNPGAAGGVVVTLDGQLVGMIGKIINSTETNTRLNYAVPNSVLAEFVAGDLKSAIVESTEKPPVDLGIRLFSHGGRSSPAYIDRVRRGGPAHKARFKPDDLIISIGGEKIGNIKDYEQALERLTVGQEVIVVVKRGVELIRKPVVPMEKKK